MVDVNPLLKNDYTSQQYYEEQQVQQHHQVHTDNVVVPSVPPVTVMGYEGASFNTTAAYMAPPAYIPAPSQQTTERPPPNLPTHVTEQQARDSLMRLAQDNFCWGSKPAREMTVSSIISSSAFHYKLDTFTEARKSVWAFEPYGGGLVDGPQNGHAPAPWSIVMQPDAMFKKQEKHREVPHTAYVKPCHDCKGHGKTSCNKCNRKGKIVCNTCNGKGTTIRTQENGQGTDTVTCSNCSGSGNRKCPDCNGCGLVNCKTCRAKGNLRFFLKLTVAWSVHTNDHIVETTAMPDHLVREAQGAVVFEESFVRVNPVHHFPNPEINSASQRLVNQHVTSHPNERILMQRHNIRVIPVSEVQAEHRDKEFTYWVYGNNNLCYSAQYPQQCCCGCTII